MLPKLYRLPSSEIKRVMRMGTTVMRDGRKIISVKNNLTVSRYAFIVPIKIDKRATVRNRLKRLSREEIQKQLTTLPKGEDVVIIIRKNETDNT